MDTRDFIEMVQELQDDFQREEEQGLLQDSLVKAQMAMAGKHACARILRRIEAREKVHVIDPRRMSRAR